MQLTVEICTGLKNNMNTEKMTAVSKYMNMEFLKVRTFQSFFSKMIPSTSFLFQKLVKTPNNESSNAVAFNNSSYFPKKDNSNV